MPNVGTNLTAMIQEAMEPYKLNRMEKAEWQPPILSFVVERHGGTALGSTRADLQHWTVNVETKEANCHIAGHRQLEPMQPRMDVKPLAD